MMNAVAVQPTRSSAEIRIAYDKRNAIYVAGNPGSVRQQIISDSLRAKEARGE